MDSCLKYVQNSARSQGVRITNLFFFFFCRDLFRHTSRNTWLTESGDQSSGVFARSPTGTDARRITTMSDDPVVNAGDGIGERRDNGQKKYRAFVITRRRSLPRTIRKRITLLYGSRPSCDSFTIFPLSRFGESAGFFSPKHDHSPYERIPLRYVIRSTAIRTPPHMLFIAGASLFASLLKRKLRVQMRTGQYARPPSAHVYGVERGCEDR